MFRAFLHTNTLGGSIVVYTLLFIPLYISSFALRYYRFRCLNEQVNSNQFVPIQFFRATSCSDFATSFVSVAGAISHYLQRLIRNKHFSASSLCAPSVIYPSLDVRLWNFIHQSFWPFISLELSVGVVDFYL